MSNFTNSLLVGYTRLVNNHSGQRTHSIDRITPHCVVGQVTASRLGDIFSSRQVSSNYGIAVDGTIGLYVEEKNRSWCSSNAANDQRAITIECASEPKPPYEFNMTVYNTLIKLCVDICKRNGKTKIIWFGDKTRSLNYVPKSNEMVFTVHRWFANKSCPGDWLYSRMGDLAKAINAELNKINTPTPNPTVVKKCPFTEPKTNLAYGSKGTGVKWIQWYINACKVTSTIKVDGDFGPATKKAVIAFQKKYYLAADGIVGIKTREALKKNIK